MKMGHSKYRFPYFRLFYRISWHGKFYEWWELPISSIGGYLSTNSATFIPPYCVNCSKK